MSLLCGVISSFFFFFFVFISPLWRGLNLWDVPHLESDYLMSSHTYAADLGRGHERGFALARSLELSIVKKNSTQKKPAEEGGRKKKKKKRLYLQIWDSDKWVTHTPTHAYAHTRTHTHMCTYIYCMYPCRDSLNPVIAC